MAGQQKKIFIYLDMDGVVADTALHARAAGVDMNSQAAHELDEEWWATIPPFEGARELYDALCALAEVNFLTGVKKGVGCRPGKDRWLRNFVPEKGDAITLDLIPLASRKKWHLAAPGRILIDDNEDNIREWEAAGGIGILHKGDFAETLAKARDIVQDLRLQGYGMPIPKPSPWPSP